jgi:hypothetical protein
MLKCMNCGEVCKILASCYILWFLLDMRKNSRDYYLYFLFFLLLDPVRPFFPLRVYRIECSEKLEFQLSDLLA